MIKRVQQSMVELVDKLVDNFVGNSLPCTVRASSFDALQMDNTMLGKRGQFLIDRRKRCCQNNETMARGLGLHEADPDLPSNEALNTRLALHGTDMEDAVRRLLEGMGENPQRPGLQKTPARFVRAMLDVTDGYEMSLDDIVGDAIFDEACTEMVVVRDIEFHTLCEHHLLPFYGRAHIGYIPNRRVLGLSKFARIVRMYARRLQVQERLTQQVADAVERVLSPQGVAVVVEASHKCMEMRGVEAHGASTVSQAMRGAFLKDEQARREFFAQVRRS